MLGSHSGERLWWSRERCRSMSSRGPTLEAKGSAQWIPISESCFELASLSIRAAQRDTHLPNVQIAVGEPWLFFLCRLGGITFLTSQSLEPAQAKVDRGKKGDSSHCCTLNLCSWSSHTLSPDFCAVSSPPASRFQPCFPAYTVRPPMPLKPAFWPHCTAEHFEGSEVHPK